MFKTNVFLLFHSQSHLHWRRIWDEWIKIMLNLNFLLILTAEFWQMIKQLSKLDKFSPFIRALEPKLMSMLDIISHNIILMTVYCSLPLISARWSSNWCFSSHFQQIRLYNVRHFYLGVSRKCFEFLTGWAKMCTNLRSEKIIKELLRRSLVKHF